MNNNDRLQRLSNKLKVINEKINNPDKHASLLAELVFEQSEVRANTCETNRGGFVEECNLLAALMEEEGRVEVLKFLSNIKDPILLLRIVTASSVKNGTNTVEFPSLLSELARRGDFSAVSHIRAILDTVIAEGHPPLHTNNPEEVVEHSVELIKKQYTVKEFIVFCLSQEPMCVAAERGHSTFVRCVGELIRAVGQLQSLDDCKFSASDLCALASTNESINKVEEIRSGILSRIKECFGPNYNGDIAEVLLRNFGKLKLGEGSDTLSGRVFTSGNATLDLLDALYEITPTFLAHNQIAEIRPEGHGLPFLLFENYLNWRDNGGNEPFPELVDPQYSKITILQSHHSNPRMAFKLLEKIASFIKKDPNITADVVLNPLTFEKALFSFCDSHSKDTGLNLWNVIANCFTFSEFKQLCGLLGDEMNNRLNLGQDDRGNVLDGVVWQAIINFADSRKLTTDGAAIFKHCLTQAEKAFKDKKGNKDVCNKLTREFAKGVLTGVAGGAGLPMGAALVLQGYDQLFRDFVAAAVRGLEKDPEEDVPQILHNLFKPDSPVYCNPDNGHTSHVKYEGYVDSKENLLSIMIGSGQTKLASEFIKKVNNNIDDVFTPGLFASHTDKMTGGNNAACVVSPIAKAIMCGEYKLAATMLQRLERCIPIIKKSEKYGTPDYSRVIDACANLFFNSDAASLSQGPTLSVAAAKSGDPEIFRTTLRLIEFIADLRAQEKDKRNNAKPAQILKNVTRTEGATGLSMLQHLLSHPKLATKSMLKRYIKAMNSAYPRAADDKFNFCNISKDGRTAIDVALDNGTTDALILCMKEAGRAYTERLWNQAPAAGKPAMHRVFEQGNTRLISAVHKIVDNNTAQIVDPTTGRHTVHAIAASGRADMMKLYLTKINQRQTVKGYDKGHLLGHLLDNNGDSIINLAVASGSSKMMQILADKLPESVGVIDRKSPFAPNSNGRNVLHHAAMSPNPKGVLNTLLSMQKKGKIQFDTQEMHAYCASQDCDGNNVLALLILNKDGLSGFEKMLGLYSSGFAENMTMQNFAAMMNVANKDGKTPLNLLAERGATSLVSKVLRTISAKLKDQAGVVGRLLSMHDHPDRDDAARPSLKHNLRLRRTALHVALANNDMATLKVLLREAKKSGVDQLPEVLSVRDISHNTVLEAAVLSGNSKAVSMIMSVLGEDGYRSLLNPERGRSNLLHSAVLLGEVSFIKPLMRPLSSFDRDALASSSGYSHYDTPVHNAVMQGQNECLVAILNQLSPQSRVMVLAKRSGGLTPMHCIGSVETVKALGKQGLSTDALASLLLVGAGSPGDRANTGRRREDMSGLGEVVGMNPLQVAVKRRMTMGVPATGVVLELLSLFKHSPEHLQSVLCGADKSGETALKMIFRAGSGFTLSEIRKIMTILQKSGVNLQEMFGYQSGELHESCLSVLQERVEVSDVSVLQIDRLVTEAIEKQVHSDTVSVPRRRKASKVVLGVGVGLVALCLLGAIALFILSQLMSSISQGKDISKIIEFTYLGLLILAIVALVMVCIGFAIRRQATPELTQFQNEHPTTPGFVTKHTYSDLEEHLRQSDCELTLEQLDALKEKCLEECQGAKIHTLKELYEYLELDRNFSDATNKDKIPDATKLSDVLLGLLNTQIADCKDDHEALPCYLLFVLEGYGLLPEDRGAVADVLLGIIKAEFASKGTTALGTERENVLKGLFSSNINPSMDDIKDALSSASTDNEDLNLVDGQEKAIIDALSTEVKFSEFQKKMNDGKCDISPLGVSMVNLCHQILIARKSDFRPVFSTEECVDAIEKEKAASPTPSGLFEAAVANIKDAANQRSWTESKALMSKYTKILDEAQQPLNSQQVEALNKLMSNSAARLSGVVNAATLDTLKQQEQLR